MMIGDILFTISFICLIYCGISLCLKYRKTKKFGYKDKAETSMFAGMMIMILWSKFLSAKDDMTIIIALIGAFLTFVVPIIYLFKVALRKNA